MWKEQDLLFWLVIWYLRRCSPMVLDILDVLVVALWYVVDESYNIHGPIIDIYRGGGVFWWTSEETHSFQTYLKFQENLKCILVYWKCKTCLLRNYTHRVVYSIFKSNTIICYPYSNRASTNTLLVLHDDDDDDMWSYFRVSLTLSILPSGKLRYGRQMS